MNQFDQLADFSAKLSQLYTDWAKQYGITLNELHFLYHIARNGQSSPSEIGEKWSLPKQTVTSVCKQLDSKGYLQFLPDENDKRSKLIALTEQGRTFTQPLIERLTECELQTEFAFGSEKLTALLAQLNELKTLFSQQLQQEAQ